MEPAPKTDHGRKARARQHGRHYDHANLSLSREHSDSSFSVQKNPSTGTFPDKDWVVGIGSKNSRWYRDPFSSGYLDKGTIAWLNKKRDDSRGKWGLGSDYRIDGLCDWPLLNSFFSRCDSHVPASLVSEELKKSPRLTAWDKR